MCKSPKFTNQTWTRLTRTGAPEWARWLCETSVNELKKNQFRMQYIPSLILLQLWWCAEIDRSTHWMHWMCVCLLSLMNQHSLLRFIFIPLPLEFVMLLPSSGRWNTLLSEIVVWLLLQSFRWWQEQMYYTRPVLSAGDTEDFLNRSTRTDSVNSCSLAIL